jgi:hypothetical protein
VIFSRRVYIGGLGMGKRLRFGAINGSLSKLLLLSTLHLGSLVMRPRWVELLDKDINGWNRDLLETVFSE